MIITHNYNDIIYWGISWIVFFEELNVMQYVLILPGDHQCMVGIKMAMFDYQRLIGMCYR